jgi:hypothetical protein
MMIRTRSCACRIAHLLAVCLCLSVLLEAQATSDSSLKGYLDYDYISFGYYQGPNSDIYEINISGLTDTDLCAKYGAPAGTLGTALWAFRSPQQDHIVYLGTNQHVYQFVTPATPQPEYVYQDLTATAGGALPNPGSALTGFDDTNAGFGQHVFYLGTNLHIYQLYLAHSTQQWVDQDLTAMTNGSAAQTGSALASLLDSQERAFYEGTNQHVYQLVTHPGGWLNQDLTSTAGAPVAVSKSALSTILSGTQDHVIYVGTNQHVYQLVTNASGIWVFQDLTSTTGGTLAASGSPLTSFYDRVGQHVFYLGGNQHVYHLYYSSSSQTWVDQDLTAMTNGALAETGSALSSFIDGQGNEQVIYEGTNQHVYQLLTQPGGWVNHDLTAETGG